MEKFVRKTKWIAGSVFTILIVMLLTVYPPVESKANQGTCCCSDFGDTCQVGGTSVPDYDECTDC